MTGKRFTLEETDWSYRIRDNGAVMKIPKIVDLLNDLNDENEELKSENQYLKSLKWNKDCINEISIGMQQRQLLERQNNKLVKEKERLKDTLAFRSNQLALMEELIDDLGTDEMCREMEDILNG